MDRITTQQPTQKMSGFQNSFRSCNHLCCTSRLNVHSYAYVADDICGLRIINISNPLNPFEVGYYDTPGVVFGVFVNNSYAYLADGGSLRIVNIVNPSSPIEVGQCDMSCASDVCVSGSYAYIADWSFGLRIIDISSPTNPYEVGHYNSSGHPWSVYLLNSYVYIADDWDGLQIYQGPITGIEENYSTLSADRLSLKVEPNPFKSHTTIFYSLSAESKVILNLYDISGRLVNTLIDEYKNPGNYQLTLNTKNLSAGVYFLSLDSQEKRIIKRLVVVK